METPENAMYTVEYPEVGREKKGKGIKPLGQGIHLRFARLLCYALLCSALQFKRLEVTNFVCIIQNGCCLQCALSCVTFRFYPLLLRVPKWPIALNVSTFVRTGIDAFAILCFIANWFRWFVWFYFLSLFSLKITKRKGLNLLSKF